MLSALLLCNTTVVYADDLHGGSSGSIDVTPTITIPPPAIDPHALDELIFRLVRPDIAGAVDSLQTWWDKWIGDRWKTDADREKDYSISSGGSTVHLHKQFVDDVNKAVQDKIHALDGYYLFEPSKPVSEALPSVISNLRSYYSAYYINSIEKYVNSDKFPDDLTNFVSSSKISNIIKPVYESPSSTQPYSDRPYVTFSNVSGFDSTYYMYLENGYLYALNKSEKRYTVDSANIRVKEDESVFSFYYNYTDLLKDGYRSFNFIKESYRRGCIYGSPFRIFYSKEDLLNFWNKGRTYAPQLPSTTISIPIKYINNSVSLPDITYNINTTNKTEVEIQNEYNTTLNNYLNDLNNFTDGPEVTPTPTPDGGFTDGTTPTPKPDFGDGSDPTNTNDWLKKIYEWLQSFGDTHSKFEKTITDYIEANDGKLDQIIEAINALSDGKTEDEKNGCKYDFAALSDFMTKLWNESDKKFDKMVELLEENNKYQKKLVNSLNEIKAILVTQTIMDVFQDRSQQTAEKAKDKFPTSLPWDIALVVNAMSAEPEKPQFNLPIQIKSLNINEEIHVDLASGEWEKLAKTCRYLLSILFILLMIQLSRKLFSNGGDD